MPASFTSFSTTGDVLETCPSLSPSSLIHSHSFPTFISSFRTTSRRISHNKFLTSSSEYSPWKPLQLNRQMWLGRRAGRFADNLSLSGQRLYSPPADIMQYQNQTNASRKSLSITFSLAQSRAKPVESHFFFCCIGNAERSSCCPVFWQEKMYWKKFIHVLPWLP